MRCLGYAIVMAAVLLGGDHSQAATRADRTDNTLTSSLGNLIQAYVEKRISRADIQISVSGIQVDAAAIPASGTRMTVEAKSGSALIGATRFLATIFRQDRIVSRFWVRARIDWLGQVVVATRPMAANERVTDESLTTQEMAMSQLRSPFGEISEVVGKRTKRAIRVGEVLRADNVEVPPTVNRGDMVKVVARGRGIELSLLGRVRQPAHIGETVHVENIGSHRTIYGTLIDPSTVLVRF